MRRFITERKAFGNVLKDPFTPFLRATVTRIFTCSFFSAKIRVWFGKVAHLTTPQRKYCMSEASQTTLVSEQCFSRGRRGVNGCASPPLLDCKCSRFSARLRPPRSFTLSPRVVWGARSRHQGGSRVSIRGRSSHAASLFVSRHTVSGETRDHCMHFSLS